MYVLHIMCTSCAGMGQVYYRQEKYDAALRHFQLASKVHPGSSVLLCYSGMALARLGQHRAALAKLNEASALDPSNPLARWVNRWMAGVFK